LLAQDTDKPAVQETPTTTESAKETSTDPKPDKPEPKPEKTDKKVPLLTEPFSDELWKHFSGKKGTSRDETWSVVKGEKDEPILVCTGEPYGYVRTKQEFTNFEFGLEWKFPKDENGNSGVLLYTNGDDRIWPKSMQVQLQQTVAGSTFPGGGAKSENELRNIPMLARPVDQWNVCHITCRDGNVTVTINDQKVGEVTGCDPAKGSIALQSEGAEIHFRRIWYRELKSAMPESELPSETIAEPVSSPDEKPKTQSTMSSWQPHCPSDRVVRDICAVNNGTTCWCDRHLVNEFAIDSRCVCATGLKVRRKRKPQVIQTLSQAARGDRRMNTEWVVLYSNACN